MGYGFKLIGADAGAVGRVVFLRGNAGCFVGAKQKRGVESFGF